MKELIEIWINLSFSKYIYSFQKLPVIGSDLLSFYLSFP